jgi:type I restriction enzyme, S subunit
VNFVMAFHYKKLGELVTIIGGGTPDRNKPHFWNGDINWISVKDLVGDTISSSLETITTEGLEKSSAKLIPKGNIILPTRMALGKVAINQIDVAINQDLKALIIKDNSQLDLYYLFYFLKSKSNFIESKGKGATVKGITVNLISNLEVPILPLTLQKKIASVLRKAQALINKRKAQIEALDQLTQSVFLEMFGDPVKNSLGFKTEPLHELCVHIFGGGTPSKSNPEYYIGNIPWVTPKDMKDIVINDSIDHINEDAIANSSAKLIPPNSLLMVIRSGILKKKLPIAINTREVTVNQDMKAFVVDKNKITVEYLLYFFEFYQKVLLNRVRSVTADNLDFQQIKEILVPVPPINKQKEFSNIFYKVLAEKNKCLQQLNELENNFNSLMQRAFKGELFND